MTLQQRNDAFRTLLADLNQAQRSAVEQTEGPVLVIAGPGTGKTHVLSARIGKILLDTDTRPQNLLCLTFTDAGANAMRQRLLGMIGPEAHRVPIYTFHAFCNRVIQENIEFFGRADLEPMSDLERIELVRGILEKLPPEHPLREGRKAVFYYERHLRDLFSTMKKESWTPGHVLKKIEAFMDGLPENPGFIYQKTSKYGKKGDLKTAKVQDAREKMDRLRAAADLYPKYLNVMQRAGRYEYEDMILWVLREFDRNETLLRSYQERFLYFLVDEYQDTNGAQNRLLQVLLDYWPNPNVFIVGDDDQSIYEFQGARLQNLVEFYQTHRASLLTVVLEENYRSTQAVLDAAAKVIGHNELRAVNALQEEGLKKELRAQTPENQSPVLRIYENRLQETAHIVHQIETLLQGGESPADIAILYARHKQAARLMTLLDKKEIPYYTKRPVNILHVPVIQQFRDLLRYLHDEAQRPFSGDHRLFRLLHAHWFDLKTLDLAKVALALPNALPQHSSVPADNETNTVPEVSNIHHSYERGKWRLILQDETRLNSLHLADAQALLRISQKIEGWIGDAFNMPLPALLERLYTQSGLLNWALAQPDKAWCLQILHTLLDFVNAEAARNPRFSLDRLLGLLDSMDDNDLPLEVQQTVRSGEGIQLLTAHSAKGLEFRHVFMLDCTSEFWEPSARGGNGRFALPDTLTLSGEEDALEARRRLFYVAMTRAKRYLNISFSRSDARSKFLKQACFVDETGLEKTDTTLPADMMSEAQALLLLEPVKPVVTLPETALLDETLQRFTLNITALNRFLRCPLAFYYQDLLNIPTPASEAATFGHAMHEVLRQFFGKMKSDKKQEFPGEETLIRLFGQEMDKQRAFFSSLSFAQRLSVGRALLRQYYVVQIPYWRRRAVVERRVDRAEFEGIPLTGVLDKIEWPDNNTIRVVDYKTGVPDPKKVAPPSEGQAYGGEYWRQLLFYKILLETARSFPEPVGSGMISWLEPDKKGVLTTTELRFSQEDRHFMENLIREVYGKIMRREFTEGCGLEDCVWCKMHRDREAPVVLTDEEEGLDDRG